MGIAVTQLLQFAVLGMATGAVYVVLAQGAVLIYRGSGILNFAHGSFAMMGAFTFYSLKQDRGWTTLSAALLSVGLVALVGALVDSVIMRRLRTASPLTRVIATLGVLVLVQGIGFYIWGASPRIADPAIASHPVTILRLSTNSYNVVLILGAVVLTAVLSVLWRYTRIGWVAEAVSESPRSAAALGWSPNATSTVTWTVGAALAGIAGIMAAPLTQLTVGGLTLLIVFVFATALVAGFRVFWGVLAAGLILGSAQAVVGNYVHVTGAADALPLIVIVGLLVLRGSALPLRGNTADRLPSVGIGRVRYRIVVPLVVVVALCISRLSSPEWQSAITATCTFAIVLLSLVVLTGYAGQLSLGQLTLAGVGALSAARFAVDLHLPFVVAVLGGALCSAAVSLLFGLPALRTRGANLAVITLALSLAVYSVVFNNPTFAGQFGIDLPSISLFGYSINPLEHPNRYANVAFLTFAIVGVVVANMRRSSLGRQLLAIRGNERAASAAGINVQTGKLAAFTVAGAIAGLGGALTGFSQTTAVFSTYNPINSLVAVAEAVTGGVGYIFGALVGASTGPSAIPAIISLHWAGFSEYITVISGALVLITLMVNPDGVVGTTLESARSLRGRKLKPSGTRDADSANEAEPGRVTPRALTITEISVTYGAVKAVSEVSLTVAPGTVHGLIGPNGSGKTSLLDAVSGFVTSSGSVRLDEEAIGKKRANQRSNAGLVRSFQGLELFDDLTVLENLQVAAETKTVWAAVRGAAWRRSQKLPPTAWSAIRHFDLPAVLNKYPEELSYGQRRLVAVARAVASSPSVLLLDEPASGLDDGESLELANMVRLLADQQGMAVLLVEHDMAFVTRSCDQVTVIDFGKVIATGTPTEIQHDPAARAAYLGHPVEVAAGPAARPREGSAS